MCLSPNVKVKIDECASPVYVFVMFVHAAMCVNTIHADSAVFSYVCVYVSRSNH